MRSILIVEEDKLYADRLTALLERQSFLVYHTYRHAAITRMALRNSPDCILINFKVTTDLENLIDLKRLFSCPVLILTDSKDSDLEVSCLRLGADDVVERTKSIEVINARIRRLVKSPRENSFVNDSILKINELEINKRNYICEYSGNEIKLTNEELDLLYYLAANKDQLVTRDTIYRTLKGASYDGVSRGVDIAISRIRDKLSKAGGAKDLIASIRGKGYMLKSRSRQDQVAA